ncbi:MAG: DUF2752 domain-containing protein [Bacteroidetes bacterium]|nr:DUF2752 domain-containing protein [Bacteroidota bacterium]
MIDFLERHLFTCSIKNFTGFDCPGCGMQRAFVALLKGDILSSLNFNPSLLPFLLTLLYVTLHLSFNFKNGARNILWLFGFTVLLMLANFVFKIILHF